MQIKIINLKFFHIIIPIIPLLLLTGPFLPDLVITITSIFFIIFFRQELILKFKEEKIIYFFLLFWICLVISSLFSNYILFSLKSSGLYLRFIIFSCVFYYLILTNSNFLERLYLCLKISIYIMCAACLFELFFQHNLYLIEKPEMRLTGTYKDEQIVGSFLSKIFPLFASLFLFLNKKINLEVVLLSILTYLVVLLSNERTAIFFTTIFYLFLVLVYPGTNIKKKILSIFLVILVFISTLFFVDDVKKRIIDLTLSQMGIFLLDSQKDTNLRSYKKSDGFFIFSKSHQTHMLTAFNMFKLNPIIGVGPKVFRKECDNQKYYISESSCTTHPHNILFQILGEVGIVGLIFLIISIFYLIKNFYLTFKEKLLINNNFASSKLCLLFIFSQNIFFLLPTGNYLNNFLSMQMFLPLGFYIYVNKLIKNDSLNNNNNN